VDPEKWVQIKEIFAAALERDAADRNAYIRQACGQDNELRGELESLLSSYTADPSAPGQAVAGEIGASGLTGQKIGPYQIISKIGAGGMGAVYLAVRADDVYEKKVAIKVVQAGINTEEILNHFRHERQILARLEHPNIARLLDGGTTDRGLPYFVMDYVEGTRLDAYSDAHKLPVAERIRLFREVCSAVQYVHQNLVVHRDLKPGNILVTEGGVPKLLDFGIAKLMKPEFFTNPQDATRAEFRLMTPGYASPEQVRGDPVTTASDVYSLGVILYELLTSRGPYRLKTESPVDVLRAVCEQEPGKPSAAAVQTEPASGPPSKTAVSTEEAAEMRSTTPEKLRRQLSGDLDTIILKALRKEPQRRYSSAEQLSEDLRRHLEGLPVKAHADSWRYRTGKFVRRRRAAVVAAVLILFTLLAGIVATTWQARVARMERARAERQFNDVRKLSTSLLFEFHSAIRDLPGSTPARKLIVQRALEYLSKLAEEAHGDPGLQRELAEAYLKVGDVQGNPYEANLGDAAGAAQSYRKALGISQELVRRNAKDLEGQRYLARSYQSLGELLPVMGNPSEGLVNFRQAERILEALYAANPKDLQLRLDLAGCYQEIGDLQGQPGIQNLGDQPGALISYGKAREMYDALTRDEPANASVERGAAVVKIRIGDLQFARDDIAGSHESYRAAVEILERLTLVDPTSAKARRLLAHAYRKMGGSAEHIGNLKEALGYYQKASAINESLAKTDPSNVQIVMGLAISYEWSADLMVKMGDSAGALQKYKIVLDLLEKLHTVQPKDLWVQGRYAKALITTAGLLDQKGNGAEAREMAQNGLRISKDLADRQDATPDDLNQYALALLTCRPRDLRERRAALAYAKKSVAKAGTADSDGLDTLAQAYFQNGEIAQAIVTEQKALDLLAPPAPHEPDSPTRQRIKAQLAAFKGGRGQY
jgi:eukaryotic-like serine/threonine-protein kinase